MSRETKTFTTETLPNGLRRFCYGEKVEAFELEDGGWLVFVNGLPIELAEMATAYWGILHSEDMRYPDGQGRNLFAGYMEEIAKAPTFHLMTKVVYRIVRTIPPRDKEP